MYNFSLKANLFVLVFMVSFSMAFAQDEEVERRIGFGPKIGLVTSEFDDSQPHTSAKIGYLAGVFISYSFSDKLSVLIEPAYLQQGGRFLRFSDDNRFYSGSRGYYITNTEVTLHNVDLPVLLRYNLPRWGDFQPNLVAGPSATYTFYANESYEKTYYENEIFSTVSENRNHTSQYEPLTISLTGGLGGMISLGKKVLLIDLRYKYGITPAKKGYSYIDLNDVQRDLQSHSAYLSIGFGF